MYSFVAFDLETTGRNPAENRIIEIGAVKVIDGRIVEEFDRLVDPQTSIPYQITQLTGISKADVAGAELIDEVLPEFLDFIGDLPLVAHNAPFDVGFLEQVIKRSPHSRPLKNKVYDTFELSKIVLPRARYHRLSALLACCNLNLEDAHQAFDDARGAAQLFLALLEGLESFDLPMLEDIERLVQYMDWPYEDLLPTIKANVVKRALERKIGQRGYNKEHLIEAGNVIGQGSCLPPETHKPITSELVAPALNRLSEVMSGYEDRPQQRQMCMAVGAAYARNNFAVIEAGTGTGKSIAYLIPAVLNSIQNGERTVISTNTKNLQEQLFYHDIPLLIDPLGLKFKAVLLKGRSNYICPRRFQDVLNNPDVELTPEERIHILPLVPWIKQTESGDIAECNGYKSQNSPSLWNKISADQGNCTGQECARFQENGCFLHRVRRQAQDAHLLVVNHSLLFSDVQAENQIIGFYDRLVIDEAHNLERVATEYLGQTLSVWLFRAVTHRLFHRSNQGETGHLLKMRQLIGVSQTDLAWKGRVQDQITGLMAEAQNLWERVHQYFKYLTDYIRQLSANKPFTDAPKIRLKPGDRAYFDLTDMTADLKLSTDAVRRLIVSLKTTLEDADGSRVPGYESIKQELSGRLIDAQAVMDTIDFFLTPNHETQVYWLEGPKRWESYDTRWRSAPLEVATLLKDQLYTGKKTVIFASATLTVGDSFAFFNSRNGVSLLPAERVIARQVGSPFNYDQQVLIVAASYLPDPKSTQFTEAVANMLKSACFLTRRGTLVLFTAYGMMNKTYQLVRDDFETHQLMLMAQGQDGSRSNLLNRFKDERASVLFGTDSFWEGVDVPGDSLEILAVVKLPFLVPDEPLVEAQLEALVKRGINSFEHYMLPKAVLKFRQGFGRLIRRKDDIGVMIVADPRVVHTRYGEVFMKSLPTGYRNARNEQELLTLIRDFFQAKSADQKKSGLATKAQKH